VSSELNAGVTVTRVELSIGALDLFHFQSYDHAFPRHSHDRFTVGVFGQGNGSIRMNGASWRAADGAILVVPPDAPHSADPLRGRGWTYRTLYPSGDVMDAALGRPSESARFSRPVVADREIAMSISMLHETLESSGSTLATEVTLLEVLARLVERHGESGASPRTKYAGSAVILARRYLDENYSAAIRLAELSSVCGMSPFHLIRSFREAVGMTPHAYLTQVRANRARELLPGGMAISAIAYRCGFSDQSHLTRTFKRIFGVTPGMYVDASSRVHRSLSQ
jgi:AraC-like DNA-binding protein